MRKIAITCPVDGDVIVPADRVVIDDEAERYGFHCPGECDTYRRKTFDEYIRGRLRDAGVRTIDEIVLAESVVLNKL